MAGPTAPNLFGYLPVTVTSIGAAPPFNVTAFGTSLGLINSDMQDPTHNSFGATGGLNIVDTDSASHATTLAAHVTVTGGGFGTGLTVTVNNVPPVDPLSLSANPIDENGTTTLTVVFTDPGTLDTHTVDIDWGDGNTESHTLAAGVLTLSVPHQYLDDGSSPGNGTPQDDYTINVTVTDDDTGSDSDSAVVTVKNVAPTLALDPVAMIDEGGTAVLSGTITDPGTLDTFTVVIDWNAGGNVGGPGEGTTTLTQADLNDCGDLDAATHCFTTTHQYLDDYPTGTSQDTYTIKVTVTDDDAVIVPGPQTLVDNSTLGYYNAALGTILDGTGPQFPCANVACGDPVIFPASEPDLSAAAGILGSWLSANPLPLNSNWSASPQAIPTTWAVNTETAIIYEINAGTGGLFNVKGNFGVDNGIFVWVNGVFKFGALAPGGVGTYEYANIDLGSLSPGSNFIQVLREDHGGATGYTTLITSDLTVAASAMATTTVLVKNVAPENLSLSLVSSSIDEDGVAMLSGKFEDVGTLDEHTVVIDWNADGNVGGPGEGTTTLTDSMLDDCGDGDPTTKCFTASHQYLDDNPTGSSSDLYAIGVTVTDDDTGSDSDSTPLTVNNLAPSLSDVLVSSSSIDEGQSVTLTGMITDTGTQDTHTVTIDWGDPNDPTSTVSDAALTDCGDLDPTTKCFSTTHTYADDGPAPGNGTASDVSAISVTVTDDDGGSDSDTSLSVTVNNVAPTLSDVLVSPGTIDEGGSVTLTGKITDPGVLDEHTVTITWGDPNDGSSTTVSNASLTDCGDLDPTTKCFSTTHAYADDGPSPGNGTAFDVSAISVSVTDDDLGSDSDDSQSVTVNNVAPVLSAISGVPLVSDNPCGTSAANAVTYLVSGQFNDPGTDTYQFVINWGDSTSDVFNVPGPGFPGAFGLVAINFGGSASHNFTAFGTYVITVSVIDDDGGTVSATVGSVTIAASASVVYDPVWGGNVLDIKGTDLDDHIHVNENNDPDLGRVLKVHSNSLATNPTFAIGSGASAIKKIRMTLCNGDDHGDVSNGVSIGAIVYGMAGDDKLQAGNGNTDDILLGGADDDMLVGGSGRDLLIGGTGSDRIVGDAQDDILIAGYTSFDDDQATTAFDPIEAALKAIMDEWTSGNSYATRVANVQSGGGATGGVKLATDGPGQTVFSDGVVDYLTGSSGSDLFFANTFADTGDDAVKDVITDLKSETSSDTDSV